jgi:hypothetical protein
MVDSPSQLYTDDEAGIFTRAGSVERRLTPTSPAADTVIG